MKKSLGITGLVVLLCVAGLREADEKKADDPSKR